MNDLSPGLLPVYQASSRVASSRFWGDNLPSAGAALPTTDDRENLAEGFGPAAQHLRTRFRNRSARDCERGGADG